MDFLADSGAFSAYTGGKVITIDEYADWCLKHADVINAAATMDVIGDPKATARNTDRLMARLDHRVPVMAVFHTGSPWEELHRICRDHRYVALGGAVYAGHRTQAMLRWCVKAHQIAREHDTRLHGFGLTKPPYPEILPWYSADSSYWTSASRTGSMSLWDGSRWHGFRVGTRSAAKHAKLIRSYGGDPARASRYGFGIISRNGPAARAEYRWLCEAPLVAWRRYERWIRAKRQPVGPPTGTTTTGTGFKLFQAVGSAGDIRMVCDVIGADDALHESDSEAEIERDVAASATQH